MENQHGNKTITQYNTDETKQYYGAIVLLSIFLVFGVVGNIHVLFVYAFRMKRSNQRVFILVIAVLDMLSCVLGIPFILSTMFRPLTFEVIPVCKIMRLFLYMFAGNSGNVLVIIAIDR